MHSAPVHLVWFRHDLRVTDNKALFYACQNTQAQVHAILPSRLHSGKPIIWLYHSRRLFMMHCLIFPIR